MFGRQARKGMRLAVLASAAGAVVIGAGPARADQAQDDQYFAGLQQIYPGRSLDASANIGNAHRICGHLGNGDSFDKVVSDVREADDNKESLEATQREVQLAKSTYCP